MKEKRWEIQRILSEVPTCCSFSFCEILDYLEYLMSFQRKFLVLSHLTWNHVVSLPVLIGPEIHSWQESAITRLNNDLGGWAGRRALFQGAVYTDCWLVDPCILEVKKLEPKTSERVSGSGGNSRGRDRKSWSLCHLKSLRAKNNRYHP